MVVTLIGILDGDLRDVGRDDGIRTRQDYRIIQDGRDGFFWGREEVL